MQVGYRVLKQRLGTEVRELLSRRRAPARRG